MVAERDKVSQVVRCHRRGIVGREERGAAFRVLRERPCAALTEHPGLAIMGMYSLYQSRGG
jgi:hypothetical protein